ncbi:MAG: phosphopantetheine-binding protein [Bacteroidales bacterium]
MDDIKVFIQEEIANLAFVKVNFDDSLIESKILDSISMIDLLVSIEEKTGKRIPQYLINEEHLDTINKIAGTLETI